MQGVHWLILLTHDESLKIENREYHNFEFTPTVTIDFDVIVDDHVEQSVVLIGSGFDCPVPF